MDGESKPETHETTRLGYCKPPERTRFKAGQSGNPRGRPKGTLNLATVLERTLMFSLLTAEKYFLGPIQALVLAFTLIGTINRLRGGRWSGVHEPNVNFTGHLGRCCSVST